MKQKRGFTLIEVMIVVSIIGILSMILIPNVGSIKLQSKNKNVAANVLLIRTYLENRSGKDAIAYQSAIDEKKTQVESLNNILKSISDDMKSNFIGSNALINPFNNSNYILNSQANINDSNPTEPSSVYLYYSTDELPSDIKMLKNTKVLKGDVFVILYSKGYVLYGIDNDDQIINSYIIKFPSIPSVGDSGVTPGDGGENENNGGDNTISGLFENGCLNIFGDSNSEINLGNGGTSMNITGSVNLQGKQIVMKQSSNINGKLSIIGTGTQNNISIGNGKNNTLTVNSDLRLEANSIDLSSNLNTYSNVIIFGNSIVNLNNVGIYTNFNNGNVQIQSGNDINVNSDIKTINSRVSMLAKNNVNFNNVGRTISLNDKSSVYIQSGKDIKFDYSINTVYPVTMVAGNSLSFSNNSVPTNMNGITYLKALTNIDMLRNITLGTGYIETNIFKYNNVYITSNLDTNVKRFNGGMLSKQPNKVDVRQPSEPAVAPPDISSTNAMNSMKNIKSGSNYNVYYNTSTYKDLAFRIIKGSDMEAIKQALIPTNENINPNIYKFLIIDGDCTIDGSINNWQSKNLIFNNFIIYCTGKITVSNNINSITFNNSSIITKNGDIPIEFVITELNKNQYTDSVKSEINTLCGLYLQ